MDKEVIELLKSVAGSTETVVIWYLVTDLAKHIIGWAGAAAVAYFFGKGFARVVRWVNRD